MKKPILTLIFSITLGISLLAANQPTNLILSEEKMINDVPFNTASIYKAEMANKQLKNLKLKEESMVNDIPFDTEKIFKDNQVSTPAKSKLQDEEFVNDIPFNTAEIVKNLK